MTFASNLAKPNANNTPANTLTSAEVRLRQSFTTGPGESGFLLNSFSFRAFNGNDFLIVSLWTDEGDSPGEKLAELSRVEARYSDHDYTFEYLDVFLFPSTKYWIQFQVRHAQYDIKEVAPKQGSVERLPRGWIRGAFPAGPSVGTSSSD